MTITMTDVNWSAYWDKVHALAEQHDGDAIADEAMHVAADLLARLEVPLDMQAEPYNTECAELTTWIEFAIHFSGLWPNGVEIDEPFPLRWKCPICPVVVRNTEDIYLLERAIENHELLVHHIP